MLATALALLIAVALARADPSYFIYPPASGPDGSFAGNVQLQRGSTVDLNWYSNISAYAITLWQQMPTDNGSYYWGIVYQTQNGLGTQNFNWVVSIGNSNITYSPVYYLWLNADQPQAISTHYFNITAAANADSSSSVSSSATSTSATSTSATSTSATSTSVTSASATSTSSTAGVTSSVASNNDSSSSAIAIGLGVGLGVGVPLILLIAAFFGFMLWRNKKATSDSTAAGGDFYGHDTKGYTAAPQHDYHDRKPVYAMHGDGYIHEAHAPTYHGPVEVPGERNMAEAPAGLKPIELPGHVVATK